MGSVTHSLQVLPSEGRPQWILTAKQHSLPSINYSLIVSSVNSTLQYLVLSRSLGGQTSKKPFKYSLPFVSVDRDTAEDGNRDAQVSSFSSHQGRPLEIHDSTGEGQFRTLSGWKRNRAGRQRKGAILRGENVTLSWPATSGAMCMAQPAKNNIKVPLTTVVKTIVLCFNQK